MNNNDAIQGVTPPPEAYGPTAPSRPPSRSNTKSPLGRVVDWAGNDVPGSYFRKVGALETRLIFG